MSTLRPPRMPDEKEPHGTFDYTIVALVGVRAAGSGSAISADRDCDLRRLSARCLRCSRNVTGVVVP